MLLTAQEARQKAEERIAAKKERQLLIAEAAISESIERGICFCQLNGVILDHEATKYLNELGYVIENVFEDGYQMTEIRW